MVQNERLTEDEVNQLRVRLGDDGTPPLSVRWVAEATGMDPEEVRGHLRAIRAERALVEPVPPKTSRLTSAVLLSLAGTLALFTGVVVTMRRMEIPMPLRPPFGTTAPPVVSAFTPSGPTVRPAETRSLTNYAPSTSKLNLPKGVQLWVVGGEREIPYSNLDGRATPRPYDEVVAKLEAAILKACIAAGPTTFDTTIPVRDGMGMPVEKRADAAHFSIETWDRADSGYLHIPPTPRDRAELHRLVESLFAPSHDKFLRGLRLNNPNADGIFQPPPGYRVSFTGRRTDIQDGGRLTYAPVDVAVLRSRLVEAIRDAITRDAEPPRGDWTQSANQEARLQRPDKALISIEGPNGTLVEGEIPNDVLRGRAAMLSLVERALAPIESINKAAKEPTRDR